MGIVDAQASYGMLTKKDSMTAADYNSYCQNHILCERKKKYLADDTRII